MSTSYAKMSKKCFTFGVVAIFGVETIMNMSTLDYSQKVINILEKTSLAFFSLFHVNNPWGNIEKLQMYKISRARNQVCVCEHARNLGPKTPLFVCR